jgi:hypothetical protein
MRIQHAKRVQIGVVTARRFAPNAAVIAFRSIRHPHSQSGPHEQRRFSFPCNVLRQHIPQSVHVDAWTELNLWHPTHLLQTIRVCCLTALIHRRHKRTLRMRIFNILCTQLARSHIASRNSGSRYRHGLKPGLA